jgi:hypothetical protein
VILLHTSATKAGWNLDISQIEKETQDTSTSGGIDDRSRTGDRGIGTLLAQMKRCIYIWHVNTGPAHSEPRDLTITRHGPDDGQETHENSDTIRPLGIVLNAPGNLVGLELGLRHGGRGDDDDGDDQAGNVDNRSHRVEICDPQSRHTAQAGMDYHDERRQQECLPICRDVVWVHDGRGRKDHGSFEKGVSTLRNMYCPRRQY